MGSTNRRGGMAERRRRWEAREDVLKGLPAQESADIPDVHANVSGIYGRRSSG
jgi:hypothetical protein